MKLPSPTTLRRYRNYITPEPGLNPAAICEIERVMRDKAELPAYVTVDEMKIRENLIVRAGKLIGFADNMGLPTEQHLASHILGQ